MKKFQSMRAEGKSDVSPGQFSSIFGKWVSSRTLWILILAVAATGAVAFGVLGASFTSDFSLGQFDTRYFYVAGRCLGLGMNPYDPSNFSLCSEGFTGLHNSGYLYPPQFATFAVLLSWLPFSAARAIVTAINLIAILYLSFYCMRGLNTASDRVVLQPGIHWFIPAIILANPFTAHVLWLGQTSLVVTAALAAAWEYGRKAQHIWLGGIFIGLSTIKPQFSFLPILWLIFERRWAVLAVGALVSALLSLPELIMAGPIKSIGDWLSALANYRNLDVNNINDLHVFGVQSLLAAAGVKGPSLFGIGLAVMVTLWWFRRHFEDWAILPLLSGLAVLFGYSHDYDLVVLVLLMPAFQAGLRGKFAEILGAICLTILLCVPNRLLGMHPSLSPVSSVDFGNSGAVRFREIVVLGFWVWLLFLSIRRVPPKRSEALATV